MLSPGPGLWSLVLGPSGPALGPDLDLTWDLDLDLSLTKEVLSNCFYGILRIKIFNVILVWRAILLPDQQVGRDSPHEVT